MRRKIPNIENHQALTPVGCRRRKAPAEARAEFGLQAGRGVISLHYFHVLFAARFQSQE
jgi:hypothetical protein